MHVLSVTVFAQREACQTKGTTGWQRQSIEACRQTNKVTPVGPARAIPWCHSAHDTGVLPVHDTRVLPVHNAVPLSTRCSANQRTMHACCTPALLFHIWPQTLALRCLNSVRTLYIRRTHTPKYTHRTVTALRQTPH